MASFLLETNDIWNIRNHNQHLIFQLIYESTTGNFILFIDRLRYFWWALPSCQDSLADTGSFLGVPPALRPSGFQHDRGSSTQTCSTEGNASGEHCQEWQLHLALLSPSLWSWASLRLGSEVRLPTSPTTSQLTLLPTPKVLLLCYVSTHGCFLYLHWLKHLLRHALLRRWQFHVRSGECSMFMTVFKSNLNPSLLRPDSQNQNLPLEIFLCKPRI